MKRSSMYSFAAALNFLACGSPPPPSAPPAEPQQQPPPVETSVDPRFEASEVVPETIVETTFHASAQAVAPGRTFMLAARFKLADGFRIGWVNPGDVGRATSVKFKAPEGFTVGGVLFPAPERFSINNGEFISYGYEDEVAIFAEVNAPSSLDPGSAYRFDLKASWLACKRECHNEGIEAYFELTADRSATASGFEPAIEAQLARLPKPLSALEGASHSWLDDATLQLTMQGGTFKQFFPETREQPELRDVALLGESMNLAFSGISDETRVAGVAVLERDGETLFAEVETSRAADDGASEGPD